MAPDSSNPPPKGGLTLYAHLLRKDDAPGTISSAPVLYKQEEKEDKKKPAFLFQPTKRPQVAAKAKSKPGAPKPSWLPTSSSSPDSTTKAIAQANTTSNPIVKTTLADWTNDDDDVNGFYGGERRQRGGRKKRKKNKETEKVETNWDEIYDPTKPSTYAEYRISEDRYRMNQAWKERLHAHLLRRQTEDVSSEGEDNYQQQNSRFAPPSNYSFAPPASLQPQRESSPPPPPPDELPDAPTGEGAYARRAQLSQTAPPPPPPAPTVEDEQISPPPESKATTSGYSSTISAEPLRYNAPTPPQNEDIEMEDLADPATANEPVVGKHIEKVSNKAPGQKDFAKRMMAKMGYVKGKGLGLNEDGIVKALSVQPEKRKKLSDAQGGGYATPAGMGKITGGTRAKGSGNPEEGKYGIMSDVVVAWGLVDGLDLQADMQRDDGGVRQKIGDEFGERFGTIQRLVFYEQAEGDSIPVFIKFTSQLSALRAVNAFGDPDYRFNGNPIRGRFYDSEKFESGDYNCPPPPAVGAT